MFRYKIISRRPDSRRETRGQVGLIVSLFMVSWIDQAICQTQRPVLRENPPNAKQSQQLFREQRKIESEKRAAENKERQERWMAERRKEFEQFARDSANGKNQRRNELIKQTLELTEAQWRVIEPKINKVYFLKDQAGINIEIGGSAADSHAVGGSSGVGYISGGMGGHGGGAGSGSKAGTASGTASTGADANGWQTVRSSGSSSTSGGGSAGSGVGQLWTGPLWRLAGRELTDGEKNCEELQKLLEDENSKQEDIDRKIEALRRARESAAKELVKARQELREVLTARQQARLVLIGLLD